MEQWEKIEDDKILATDEFRMIRNSLVNSYRSAIYANLWRFDFRAAAIMAKSRLSFIRQFAQLHLGTPEEPESDEEDSLDQIDHPFYVWNEAIDEMVELLKESDPFTLEDVLLDIYDMESTMCDEFNITESEYRRAIKATSDEITLVKVNGDYADVYPETYHKLFDFELTISL